MRGSRTARQKTRDGVCSIVAHSANTSGRRERAPHGLHRRTTNDPILRLRRRDGECVRERGFMHARLHACAAACMRGCMHAWLHACVAAEAIRSSGKRHSAS